MNYETHQRHHLEAIFKENKEKSFNVEDLKEMSKNIPQSTLYRLLGRLEKEGYIKKCPSSSRIAEYQYSDKEHCPYHMHIKCICCGRIEHISNEDTLKIDKIIKNDLEFEVFNSSMLEGICKECNRK